MASEPTPPARCAICHGENIELVLMTTIAVYWRCRDCGSLWFVEHEPRPLDPDTPPENGE